MITLLSPKNNTVLHDHVVCCIVLQRTSNRLKHFFAIAVSMFGPITIQNYATAKAFSNVNSFFCIAMHAYLPI